MPQHRLAMECVVGRLLEPDEVVHHLDGVRSHNWPENLQLLDRSTHGREHGPETAERSRVPLDEAQVRAALQGRSTAEAAALLGVHHQTLRNRFGHLLDRRRGPGAPLESLLESRLRELAADPSTSASRACELLGVTSVTLRSWCRIAGIEWVRAPSGRPRSRPT